MKALITIVFLLAATVTDAETNASARALTAANDVDRIVVWDSGRPTATMRKTSSGYLLIDASGRASTYRRTSTGYVTIDRAGRLQTIDIRP